MRSRAASSRAGSARPLSPRCWPPWRPQTFRPPTKVTVKAFLLTEWLPTVKGSLRPTTYASYDMLAREHIIPRLGALQLQKLSPAAINALYAISQNTDASTAAARCLLPRYVACTPSCTAPVTMPCAGDT